MSFMSFVLLPEQLLEKNQAAAEKRSNILASINAFLMSNPSFIHLRSDYLDASAYYLNPENNDIYELSSFSGQATKLIKESEKYINLMIWNPV